MFERLVSVQRLRARFLHYGLTPAHLAWRLSGKAQTAVLANSIPKAGTNLLIEVLSAMFPMHRKFQRTYTMSSASSLRHALPRKSSGKFLVAHLHHSRRNEEIVRSWHGRHILMVRDPRDLALSNAEYLTRGDKSHRLHNYFSGRLKTDHDRLTASIRGVDKSLLGLEQSSESIGWHIRKYLGWLEGNQCLVVRFEDIIGPNGGGSLDLQMKCVRSIAEYIDMDFDDRKIKRIADSVFNVHSRTFNKGQIARWKKHFSPSQRELFAGVAGDCLLALNYERDDAWVRSA